MTITEVKQALGSWEIRLRDTTPKAIVDRLTYFGHIVVAPGRLNPAEYGDALLSAARYVGVYRSRSATQEYLLRGSGMAFWLGDEDGKGDVFESGVVLSGASFAASISALLPPSGAITAGTINSIAGTYSGTHRWQTSRSAIEYVSQLFGGEYRVNGNGTLDAGTIAQLYVTDPKTILLRRASGADLRVKSLPGAMELGTDAEDYTTRVVLLAEGQGDQIITGDADLGVVPFKDIHGNDLVMTRLVSESDTEAGNADARAAIYLNQFSEERQSVTLNTNAFDIKGDLRVGDYLYVYDPPSGYEDPTIEFYWEGQPLNPVALRCIEMTWPVPEGWTVAFRRTDGEWIDLSQYYAGESGETSLTVGALSRALVSTEPVGFRPSLPESPTADLTVPAAPTFTDFSFGSYQSNTTNTTKSAVRVTWSTPLNTDSSVITDGAYYEIRYRVAEVIGYEVKWGAASGYKWGQLEGNPWGAPLSEPVEASPEWSYIQVGWGINAQTILELTPGVTYDFEIRAVDSASPPHFGAWSATSQQTTVGDLFAPSVPAAPTVAGSMVAIQVSHTLGKASGGTFNLEADLTRLTVHVGGSASFFPDDSNQVGELAANIGMMLGNIPAVGTFPITPTETVYVKVIAVDRSGNKSQASAAATVTAELIDDAHISDLTVSKLTAGTINADMILGAAIRTALTGSRVELSSEGIKVYNSSGAQTMSVDSATGSIEITGTFKADLLDGQRVEILDHDFWGPALAFSPGSIPIAPNPSEGYLACDNEDIGTPFTTMALVGPTYDVDLANEGDNYYSKLITHSTPTAQRVVLASGRGYGLSAIESSQFEVGADTESYIYLQGNRIGFSNNSLGFFATTPINKPTVTGSRGGNAALASLCTALANLGLITNSTS